MKMLIVDPQRLVDAMIACRLNCKALGRVTKLSSTTINRLTRRPIHIRFDTLGRIAAALNIDYRTLLKEDHHDRSPDAC